MTLTTDTRVRIVDAMAEDILPIAQGMRRTDRLEIRASHGLEPVDALLNALAQSSICKTVLFNGLPIAMFGIVPSNDQKTASIWCLGTDLLDQIHVCFGRMSRKIINQFLEIYPALYNFVDARNEKTIGWLKWCGAEFDEPKPYGVEQLLFQHFIFRRKDRENV